MTLAILWNSLKEAGSHKSDILFTNEFYQETLQQKRVDSVELGFTDEHFIILHFVRLCKMCNSNSKTEDPCFLISSFTVSSISLEKLPRRRLLVWFSDGFFSFFKLKRLEGCGRAWARWRTLVTSIRSQKEESLKETFHDEQRHSLLHFQELESNIKREIRAMFNSSGKIAVIKEIFESEPFDTGDPLFRESSASKDIPGHSSKEAFLPLGSNQELLSTDGEKKFPSDSAKILFSDFQHLHDSKNGGVKERVSQQKGNVGECRDKPPKTEEKSRRMTRVINRFGEGIPENCIFELTMGLENNYTDSVKRDRSPEDIALAVDSFSRLVCPRTVLDEEDGEMGLFDDFCAHKLISKACARANRQISSEPLPALEPLEVGVSSGNGYENKIAFSQDSFFCHKKNSFKKNESTESSMKRILFQVPLNLDVFLRPFYSRCDSPVISLPHLKRWNSEVNVHAATAQSLLKLKDNVGSLPDFDGFEQLVLVDREILFSKRRPPFKVSHRDWEENDMKSLSFWVLDENGTDGRIYHLNDASRWKESHMMKMAILKSKSSKEFHIGSQIKLLEMDLEEMDSAKNKQTSDKAPWFSAHFRKVLCELKNMHPKRQRFWSDIPVDTETENSTKIMNSPHRALHRHDSRTECFPRINPVQEFCPCDIAHYLNYINRQFYASLQAGEVIRLFKKPSSITELNCPYLVAVILFFSRIAHLVTSTILDQKEKHGRAEAISFFVQLAHNCLMLDDYQSSCSVLSGITDLPLLRMTATWKFFKKHYGKMFSTLKELVTSSFCEKKMTEQSEKDAAIPFMGDFLTSALHHHQRSAAPEERTRNMKRNSNWSSPFSLAELLYIDSSGYSAADGSLSFPAKEKVQFEIKMSGQSSNENTLLKRLLHRVRDFFQNLAMFSYGENELTSSKRHVVTDSEFWPSSLQFIALENLKIQLQEKLEKFKRNRPINETLVAENIRKYILLSPYDGSMRNLRRSREREP